MIGISLAAIGSTFAALSWDIIVPFVIILVISIGVPLEIRRVNRMIDKRKTAWQKISLAAYKNPEASLPQNGVRVVKSQSNKGVSYWQLFAEGDLVHVQQICISKKTRGSIYERDYWSTSIRGKVVGSNESIEVIEASRILLGE